ncbi:MFS transporter [Candidatus Saccharibacteria bacterium]|nr:MFS transporter [Candidatus Saccharibacteria bacterium]
MVKKVSKHASNKWVILALLTLAQFMVVLDIAIVNVALPSISADLHFAPNDLQWVVTAYTLTFGGFLLLGGRAADLYGRRRLFMISVGMFGLASLACGVAQSDSMLIITRAIQGLAAAFMSPVALSLVLTEFKEGKDRNRALGVWAAVSAGGAAVGVLLGGVLTQYLDWRWNFFVNVPIGILVVLAAAQLLPHHIGEETKKMKLDLPGATTATAGLMALVYGLSKAPADGWGSQTVISFLVASAVLLVAFVINESRTEQPLMPLKLFKIRNVSGGNLTSLAIACTLFSMFFFITLYVQTVLGYSPVKTGLAFLPVTFIIGITSGVVSNVIAKTGHKPFLVAGPVILAVGLFLLTNIRVNGNYMHDVFPGLAVCALGMGLAFIAMTLAATSGVPKHFSGLASGVLNTSQQVGGAIGLAILSAVFASTFKSDIASHVAGPVAQVHGYRDGLRVGVGLAIAAAAVALLVVKNEKVKPDLAAGL